MNNRPRTSDNKLRTTDHRPQTIGSGHKASFFASLRRQSQNFVSVRRQSRSLPSVKRRRSNAQCSMVYSPWSVVCGLLSVIMLLSCKSQYMVRGSSNVDELEGKVLTLKVYVDGEMKSIDSTRVVHGKFSFGGGMDSTMLANVFMGDLSLMPIVLEEGEVKLTIGETQQTATGTPLNDTLSGFIQRKTQLDARMAELPHLHAQMIMDGTDYDEIMYELDKQSRELSAENDELISRFIRANYNNVLGPGIFMIMTSHLPHPVLTPQIEQLIIDAPPYFLGHPYVREYIQKAKQPQP
ncbi:MAG: DUF4369 domain-containing protein [Bacteroidaceae bacterium]|nr:DUF4369 domain-containing protein [Bacteroidaceae bacterium]